MFKSLLVTHTTERKWYILWLNSQKSRNKNIICLSYVEFCYEQKCLCTHLIGTVISFWDRNKKWLSQGPMQVNNKSILTLNEFHYYILNPLSFVSKYNFLGSLKLHWKCKFLQKPNQHECYLLNKIFQNEEKKIWLKITILPDVNNI